LRFEREVGQLDFNAFTAQTAGLNTGTVHAGNPTLNPGEDWVAETAWDRHLFRLFRDDVLAHALPRERRLHAALGFAIDLGAHRTPQQNRKQKCGCHGFVVGNTFVRAAQSGLDHHAKFFAAAKRQCTRSQRKYIDQQSGLLERVKTFQAVAGEKHLQRFVEQSRAPA